MSSESIWFGFIALFLIGMIGGVMYNSLKASESSVEDQVQVSERLEEFRQELALKLGPEWIEVNAGDLVMFENGGLAVVTDFIPNTIGFQFRTTDYGFYMMTVKEVADLSPKLITGKDQDEYRTYCERYVRQAAGLEQQPSQQQD